MLNGSNAEDAALIRAVMTVLKDTVPMFMVCYS